MNVTAGARLGADSGTAQHAQLIVGWSEERNRLAPSAG